VSEPIEVEILKALLTQLGTLPDTPVASPLVAFTPPTSGPYLEAHPVMRAEPDRLGLAFTSSKFNRGVFQVDAVVPDNKGEAPGLRLAALVAARFAIGTVLVAGSYRLQFLKEPTIAAAVKDAPWVRFPVSIPYLLIN
jgi:hypothetical protein